MYRKLWVDDLRPPPDDLWLWVKTSERAIEVLTEQWFDVMSLDHDLGGDDTTRAVVMHLCYNPSAWPARVYVHSQNNVGVRWLQGMVDRYHPSMER